MKRLSDLCNLNEFSLHSLKELSNSSLSLSSSSSCQSLSSSSSSSLSSQSYDLEDKERLSTLRNKLSNLKPEDKPKSDKHVRFSENNMFFESPNWTQTSDEGEDFAIALEKPIKQCYSLNCVNKRKKDQFDIEIVDLDEVNSKIEPVLEPTNISNNINSQKTLISSLRFVKSNSSLFNELLKEKAPQTKQSSIETNSASSLSLLLEPAKELITKMELNSKSKSNVSNTSHIPLSNQFRRKQKLEPQNTCSSFISWNSNPKITVNQKLVGKTVSGQRIVRIDSGLNMTKKRDDERLKKKEGPMLINSAIFTKGTQTKQINKVEFVKTNPSQLIRPSIPQRTTSLKNTDTKNKTKRPATSIQPNSLLNKNSFIIMDQINKTNNKIK